MTSYIDAHRDQFGVEPICEVLQVAPPTYHAAKSRPPVGELVIEPALVGMCQMSLIGADGLAGC